MIVFRWFGVVGRNLLLAKWAEDDRRQSERWAEEMGNAEAADSWRQRSGFVRDSYDRAKTHGGCIEVDGVGLAAFQDETDFIACLPLPDHTTLTQGLVGSFRGIPVLLVPPPPVPAGPPGYTSLTQ